MMSFNQFSISFPFSGPRASPTYAAKPDGMVFSPKSHRLNSHSSPCASRKAVLCLSSSAISNCVNPEARSMDVKRVDPLIPSKMPPMLPYRTGRVVQSTFASMACEHVGIRMLCVVASRSGLLVFTVLIYYSYGYINNTALRVAETLLYFAPGTQYQVLIAVFGRGGYIDNLLSREEHQKLTGAPLPLLKCAYPWNRNCDARLTLSVFCLCCIPIEGGLQVKYLQDREPNHNGEGGEQRIKLGTDM